MCGREVGENGTPHLQGHIECERKVRLNQLKRWFVDSIHFEVRRGYYEDSEEYCSKEDEEPYRIGHRISKGKGKRTDIADLYDAISRGDSLRTLVNEHFGSYIRYHRGIDRARSVLAQRIIADKQVVVHYGDTGLGKSHDVYQDHDIEDIFEYPGGGWFDGYDGQSVVIIDDFSPSDFKISYLLKLLDKYPMQVPIKGSI